MNRNDFSMLDNNIIYFDNGATTFKPNCVLEMINEYYTKYTSNAHRGDYSISLLIDKLYEQTRTKVMKFINANNESEIIFTKGATESLNMVVFGFMQNYLKKGDEVLLTKAEHASNVLPWLELEKKIGNGSYSEIAVLSKDSASYIDNFIVASNETYYYRIIALDSENNKDVSAECSIAAVLPQAPASLSLSHESNTKIILSWIDKSTNETGFSIERKTGTGSYVLLGTVDENVTSFEDNTVSSDYTYTYRVWANSYFGNSTASSNEVTITPNTVKSPNSLDAVVISGNTVRLTWTYPASNAYTTVIERKTGETGTWTKLYEEALGVLRYKEKRFYSCSERMFLISHKIFPF